MRRIILIGLLINVAIVLAACGGAPAAQPPSPSPAQITLSTNPSPARLGKVELVLMITDAAGKPLEGARVDVSADHTEMSGMNMSGPATEQGGGRYSINANFGMSGKWKLTVYVRKQDLDYQEDMELPVQ